MKFWRVMTILMFSIWAFYFGMKVGGRLATSSICTEPLDENGKCPHQKVYPAIFGSGETDTIEIEEDPFIYKTPVPRIWRNAEGTPIPSPTPINIMELGPSLNVTDSKQMIATVPAPSPTPTPDNLYRWMNAGGKTFDYDKVPLTLDDDGRVYLATDSILAIAKTVQIMNDLKNEKNNYRYMWTDPYGYDDLGVRILLLDYEGATSTPNRNPVKWISFTEAKDLPVTGWSPVTVRGEDEETDPDI